MNICCNRFVNLLMLMLTMGPVFADDAEVQAGAELFADYCSNCHGDDRDGIAEFTDDVDTFNDRLAGITEEMPDFTDFFEEDEIAAMYAYLVATNKGE